MSGWAGRERSGEVDALRCFAMLSVMALHAHLLPLGWIGVWLFYVISGYVVTLTVLSRRTTGGSDRPLVDFLRRRSARILPLYYGYLCVGLVVAAVSGLRQDGLSIASLALFFDNLTVITGQGHIAGWPSGHLWTLSVEMQFYVVYGCALCLLPARTTRRLLVAFLMLCPLARLALGLWLDGAHWAPLDAAFAVYVAPGLHFDIFAMGSLLAFASVEGTLPRLARPIAALGLAVLLLYAGSYCAINLLGRGAHGTAIIRNVVSGILFGEHREAFVYSAVGLAMTGLVALAASGDRLVTPLLRLRPLQRIGEISYGGYVYHQLGLGAAAALLARVGVVARHGSILAHSLELLIGVALTLILAEASFRWLETPCRRLLSAGIRHRAAPLLAPTT